MDKAVSEEDCLSYHILFPSRVSPGLPSWIINMAMSPEKWIENPELVGSNRVCNVWSTIETRHISSYKTKTSDATCYDHLEIIVNFMHNSLVVPCPVSPKFLTSNKVRSSQKEWSLSVIFTSFLCHFCIPLSDCFKGRIGHHKPISVVQISVQYLSVIIVKEVYHVCVIILHWECPLL